MTSVEDWQDLLCETGRLTPKAVDSIVAVHGSRGRRAIEAVGEERIKEYNDFTVVVGHEDEYIVEDGACTCEDAQYNLDREDPTQLCWHAIAAAIARRVGALDRHEMWYSDVRELI